MSKRLQLGEQRRINTPGFKYLGAMRSKRPDSWRSREFPTAFALKLFGSFGMTACRKWNRNLRNVGYSRTVRSYRSI